MQDSWPGTADPSEGREENPDASSTPETEDPNVYAYVVNKFTHPETNQRWVHQAVTGYLSAEEAIAWIESGGPRA